MSKKPVEGCSHQWKQTGYWHGKDENLKAISGPLAICTECDGITHFTGNEWRALPEEIKTELDLSRTTS